MREAMRIPSARASETVLDGVVALGMLFLPALVLGAVTLLLPPLLSAPLVLIGVAILLRQCSTRESLRSASGLRRPPAGAGSWIVAAALVTAALAPALVVLNHETFGGGFEAADFTARVLEQKWGWIPWVALAVVASPVLEELVLRGWLLGRLERRFDARAALLTSALLFSVLHGTPWKLPYYFVMGLLFGAAVLVARTVWAGIALHLAYNASLLLIATRLPTRDDLAGWVAETLGSLAPEGCVVVGFVILAGIARKVGRLHPEGSPAFGEEPLWTPSLHRLAGRGWRG